MEALEVRYSQRLGIADPYADGRRARQSSRAPSEHHEVMSNAHLPKDTAETPSPASGGDQISSTRRACSMRLLSRIGLRSPSLREMLEADLKGDAEADAAAAFSNEEREMLQRLLRFGGSRVDDIMVPRADIIALEESDPLPSCCARSARRAFRAYRCSAKRSMIRAA